MTNKEPEKNPKTPAYFKSMSANDLLRQLGYTETNIDTNARPKKLSKEEQGFIAHGYLITPEAALALIFRSKDLANRRIGGVSLFKMVEDHKASTWKYPAQPLIVDSNWNIIEGQHRLWAVVFSGKPAKFVVMMLTNVRTTDQRLETLSVVDLGKPRSTAQQLEIAGVPRSHDIAATARLLCAINIVNEHKLEALPQTVAQRLSSPVIQKFSHENMDLLQKVCTTAKIVRYTAASGLSAAYFLCYKANSEKATEFFETFATNAHKDLRTDEPAYSKEQKILARNLKDKKGTISRTGLTFGIAAICIKAYNAWRQQKPISLLRWFANEPFPMPVKE